SCSKTRSSSLLGTLMSSRVARMKPSVSGRELASSASATKDFLGLWLGSRCLAS
ncbi:hypothetical protein V6Z96_005572, partial [Aspergillus fumigatus]